MATKESNTRSFILRIDGETMEALEKWAADEFRSTNGQLQWIIAEALRRSGRKPRAKRKVKEDESNEE
ncbi:MAG: DNA-binding protein [Alistipes sp.]|nr:DNA-binding protein [Alistipes sp.]